MTAILTVANASQKVSSDHVRVKLSFQVERAPNDDLGDKLESFVRCELPAVLCCSSLATEILKVLCLNVSECIVIFVLGDFVVFRMIAVILISVLAHIGVLFLGKSFS